MPELTARLRAVLRRPGAALGARLNLGNLSLDSATRQVWVDGGGIELSVRETAMLELLLRRQGNVVAREVLEQQLYSFDAQPGSNALEVLVHRLRRRLQEAAATPRVHTVRGVGYLLIEAE
jgi:DNA-binding response OmpR family regulator